MDRRVPMWVWGRHTVSPDSLEAAAYTSLGGCGADEVIGGFHTERRMGRLSSATPLGIEKVQAA